MSTRTDPPARAEHPTRHPTIGVVADVLKERDLSGFRVEYLVDSALLATYSEGVETTIRFVHDVLASATTFEEFREGIFTANASYVLNEELRSLRRLRAHTMAFATNGMADLLAADQQRLTDEYATAIISAQEKGWVRKSVDPLALAVFVQAYSFGVIVDDVSATHLGPDRWIAVIEDYFRSCVFEPDAHVRP